MKWAWELYEKSIFGTGEGSIIGEGSKSTSSKSTGSKSTRSKDKATKPLDDADVCFANISHKYLQEIVEGTKLVEWRKKSNYWTCRLYRDGGEPKRFIRLRGGRQVTDPQIEARITKITTVAIADVPPEANLPPRVSKAWQTLFGEDTEELYAIHIGRPLISNTTKWVPQDRVSKHRPASLVGGAAVVIC